jgi:hypothetical protein
MNPLSESAIDLSRHPTRSVPCGPEPRRDVQQNCALPGDLLGLTPAPFAAEWVTLGASGSRRSAPGPDARGEAVAEAGCGNP